MVARRKYPVVNGQKECGHCGKFLPVAEYYKVGDHFLPKCKKCLSKYNKEYNKRPGVKEYHQGYMKEYMKDENNQIRARAASRKAYKLESERSRAKRKKYKQEWVVDQKIKAVEYKGGRCMLCGYANSLAGLDFHHLDPKTKERKPTQYKCFEKNKPELDKCVLLCVRCHREVHAGVTKLPKQLDRTG